MWDIPMFTVSRLHQVVILSKLRFVSRDEGFLFQMLAKLRDFAPHSVHEFLTQVQRNYQDFLDLEEFLRTSAEFSRMSGLPQRLPQLLDGDTAPLSSFLQQILLQMGGFLWNCPRLLCFLDDTHGKQSLRDAHVGVLNQKVNPVTIIYPPISGYDWDDLTSFNLQKK
jgi:hypothetical protein